MTAYAPTAKLGPAPLARIRDRAADLVGLRAGAAAFVAGAIGGLAHAPLHLFPLLIVATTALVWLLDGAARLKMRRAAGFWRAWCFGAGYFAAGTWWIGNAFLVDADVYGALAPFAIVGMAGGLALFWGAAGAVAAALWREDWRRIAVFVLCFGAAELARSVVLSGFPWNLYAYVWPAGGPISQAASVLGAFGLSILTLAAFAAPAALGGPDRNRAGRIAPPMIAFALFAMIFAAGIGRLAGASSETAPEVRLRLVQTQIPQDQKWRPENRDDIINHYLQLTSSPGLGQVTHVIWAETALPVLLLEESDVLERIERTIGNGRALLTGTVRRDSADSQLRYFNSFLAIDFAGGAPQISLYDKHKLVPFGEMLPAEDLLTRLGFSTLVNVGEYFESGPGPAVIPAIGLAPAFAPQICYEAIFPGFTLRGLDRPGWIVNVSNDSWFGTSVGPYQLFNQARYRAIEEGLPIARTASGGVSAIVDPYGRVTHRLAITDDGILDAPLPAALHPTVYALIGEVGVILALIGAGIFAFTGRRRRLSRQ